MTGAGFAGSSPGTKVNEVDLDARGGESAEPGGFRTPSSPVPGCRPTANGLGQAGRDPTGRAACRSAALCPRAAAGRPL